MSERGLLLALQRIHDDPGFTDRVAEDPEGTLGLYDLDQEECDALISAVTNRDSATIRRMASQAGIDWTAGHIGGAGALDQQEVSVEETKSRGIEGPGALPGDAYEGVTPTRPAGT
jgi:hypothetical protein